MVDMSSHYQISIREEDDDHFRTLIKGCKDCDKTFRFAHYPGRHYYSIKVSNEEFLLLKLAIPVLTFAKLLE